MPFPAESGVDLFYQITLVVFFVIFLYLHANHIRYLASGMADTARPQTPTPTRRLFKASNKTPPVKKLKSTINNITPQSHEVTPKSVGDVVNSAEKPLSETPNKLFRKVSSRFSHAAPKSSVDDIAKSTVPAPYPASDSTGETPIGLIDNDIIFTPSATDTVSGSIGLPRDASRTASWTGTAGPLSDPDSDPNPNATDNLTESITAATGAANGVTRNGTAATPDDVLDSAPHVPRVPDGVKDDAPPVPTQMVNDSSPTGGLSDDGVVGPTTDIAKVFEDGGNREMSEFVKALTAAQASKDPAAASDAINALKDTFPPVIAEKAQTLVDDAMYLPIDPVAKLPANDASAATKSDEPLNDSAPKPADVQRLAEDLTSGEVDKLGDVQAAVEDVVGTEAPIIPDTEDVTGKASGLGDNLEGPTQTATAGVSTDVRDTAQNITSPPIRCTNDVDDDEAISRVAQAVSDVKLDTETDLPVSSPAGVPDTSNVSRSVQGGVGGTSKDIPGRPPYPNLIKNAQQIQEGLAGFMRRASSQQVPTGTDSDQVDSTPEDVLQTANDASSNALRMPDPLKASEEVKSTVDDASSPAPTEINNLGNPSRIVKQMEIPIPIPIPDQSQLPNPSTCTGGLDRSRIPNLEYLRRTSDLPSIDGLEDPPEEILDPDVHSPRSTSTIISPVPRISRVAPITSQPPPHLSQLAKGLEGKTVDDVGNIVDESGKVLGHATGDLPSMIGKMIQDNGEVYGENGELIGFVMDNFTGFGQPPPPSPPPSQPAEPTPLPGGLMVDTQGNILDGSGNIIGRLNNNAGGQSFSSQQQKKADDAPKPSGPKYEPMIDGQQETQDDKKDNKGIPADIFLDVKSTPEGIQLTIRIPTVFAQEPRRS